MQEEKAVMKQILPGNSGVDLGVFVEMTASQLTSTVNSNIPMRSS